MSRRFFTGLVIMMALSIVGITWVQINWIKNAVSILNENFNGAVFNSLNNSAGEIESLRKMNFFNNFGGSSRIIGEDSSGSIEGYVSFDSYVSHGGSSFSINIDNKIAPLYRAESDRPETIKQTLRQSSVDEGGDSVTLTPRRLEDHLYQWLPREPISDGN